MSQQPPPSHTESFRNFLSWFHFFARTLACSLEVFLHRTRTIGSRYLGIQVLAAAGIAFFFPAIWKHGDPRPQLVFWSLFLLRCSAARYSSVVRRIRGNDSLHSLYSGEPHLARLLPRLSERYIKLAIEPALVLGIGVGVRFLNVPLGTYLMVAAVGLAFSVYSSLAEERDRLSDMNDTQISQEQLLTRWRRTPR